MCAPSIANQDSTGNSSQCLKAIKITKIHIDWKERNKIILIYR